MTPTFSDETPRALEESALQAANNRIRDAAKWLIVSSAAVGAALLAGTQLSNIGKLDAGLRLAVAFVGAAVGLGSVIFAIFVAVRLLLPVTVTLDELVNEWEAPKKRLEPAITFFKDQRKYLQGFETAKELRDFRQEAVDRLNKAPDGTSGEEEKYTEVQASIISDLDERIEDVEAIAQTRTLEGQFSQTLRLLLIAVIAAAVGVVAFAWASNPPMPPTPVASLRNARLIGANLRDADLTNTKLDNANLTNADLTGAKLDKASTIGVVWKNTTCPDGENSDTVGNTCSGHLSK